MRVSLRCCDCFRPDELYARSTTLISESGSQRPPFRLLARVDVWLFCCPGMRRVSLAPRHHQLRYPITAAHLERFTQMQEMDDRSRYPLAWLAGLTSSLV